MICLVLFIIISLVLIIIIIGLSQTPITNKEYLKNTNPNSRFLIESKLALFGPSRFLSLPQIKDRKRKG